MSTLDVIEVEKPVLSFNDTTSIYDLSYLCKDTSNTFYTVNIKFKFINGVLTIVSETLYKPSNDALHQNFGTYGSTAGTYNTIILPTLCASNIFGAYAGFIDVYDSTFTYGVDVTNILIVQPTTDDIFTTSFITTQNGVHITV